MSQNPTEPLSSRLDKAAQSAFAREPLADIPARLSWRKHFSEIIFSDPPYVVLQVTPDFRGCHPELAKRGIVWDPLTLMDSVRRPGASFLLTCDCGYAPDAGIEEPVFVSHPAADKVVWELDVEGLRPALDEHFEAKEGFVRLTFRRDEYEADVRALLREIQAAASRPVAITEMSEASGIEYLRAHYPETTALPVEELEPDKRGNALERLMAIDPDAGWERQSLLPSEVVLEFGFFGEDLLSIDGQPLRSGWPVQFFTRWEALAAFHDWMGFVRRRWVLCGGHDMSGPANGNDFVLVRACDKQTVHWAGQRFAEIVQQCFEEGDTAPGVAVRYRICPLPVAEVGSASALEGIDSDPDET